MISQFIVIHGDSFGVCSSSFIDEYSALTINELPTNVASMSGIVTVHLARSQMCRKAISFNNIRIL